MEQEAKVVDKPLTVGDEREKIRNITTAESSEEKEELDISQLEKQVEEKKKNKQ
jgi:hypothetical protein